jgi:hypothetical protein
MGLFYLLSAWLYGGDVAALSDPVHAVREAAHQRLKQAGWLAFGALDTKGSTPESAERCDRLSERLPGADALVRHHSDKIVERFTTSAAEVPELTPQAWLALEPAVCRAAVECAGVWVVNPKTNSGSKLLLDHAGYVRWVRSPQFYSDSHPGEIRLLCESIRRHRQGR